MTRRKFSSAALLIALGIAAAAPGRAPAQAPGEPAVVLTVKSAGEVLDDLRYLMAAAPAGDPGVGQALQQIDQFRKPGAIPGLDLTKPLGAFGSMPKGPGDMPSAVAFVPVTDAKAFLDFLKNNGLNVEAEADAPGFTHKITLPNSPMPLFVTSGGGYLYVSLSPTGADALKAMKPASLLPKRPGAGDISLSIRLDRLGEDIRNSFNMGLESSLNQQRDRQPGETDEAFAARTQFLDLFKDAMEGLVRDGRELSLDVIVDSKAERFGLELNSSARPNTPYASALQKLAGKRSRFRGLTEGSALGMVAAVPVTPALRDLLGKAVEHGKAEALKDPKAPKEVVDQVFATLKSTLTADSLDAALAFQGPTKAAGQDPAYTGVVAVSVQDGANLDKAFRELAKSAPEDKRKDIKIDAGKASDGTAIHKITPSDQGPSPFGKNPSIFAAFRKDVAVMTAGPDGQALLNAALDSGAKKPVAAGEMSGAPTSQVEMTASASRTAAMNQDPVARQRQTAAAAEIFSGAAAKKDRVSLTLGARGDTLTFRLLGDGPVLKYFARLGRDAQAGQPGGGR